MAAQVEVDAAIDDILTIVISLFCSNGMKACIVQWAPTALAHMTSSISLELLKVKEVLYL